MDRWKMAALVFGGAMAGMVYGSACGISASASGATGSRAVVYLLGQGTACPDGFSDVGYAPTPYAGSTGATACLED